MFGVQNSQYHLSYGLRIRFTKLGYRGEQSLVMVVSSYMVYKTRGLEVRLHQRTKGEDHPLSMLDDWNRSLPTNPHPQKTRSSWRVYVPTHKGHTHNEPV